MTTFMDSLNRAVRIPQLTPLLALSTLQIHKKMTSGVQPARSTLDTLRTTPISGSRVSLEKVLRLESTGLALKRVSL